MVREVIKEGSDILTTVCTAVTDPASEEIKTLVADLKETLVTNVAEGLGLAAPQVGQNLRLFVMRSGLESKVTPVKEKPLMAVINPEIKKVYPGSVVYREGCLSVPEKIAVVERYKEIKVKFYDEDGNKQELRLRGTDAVVFQHEYDHLDGIMMTDKRRALKVMAMPAKKEEKKPEEPVAEAQEEVAAAQE